MFQWLIHSKDNLVSGNATKHIVSDNINVTKHYVGSMVRFDTLFCRDIESFFCSFKAPILFIMGSLLFIFQYF
jgi:hypothetical protein